MSLTTLIEIFFVAWTLSSFVLGVLLGMCIEERAVPVVVSDLQQRQRLDALMARTAR